MSREATFPKLLSFNILHGQPAHTKAGASPERSVTSSTTLQVMGLGLSGVPMLSARSMSAPGPPTMIVGVGPLPAKEGSFGQLVTQEYLR